MRQPRQKKNKDLNIFYIYILVIVIMDICFYPLFPLLLNYPPGSINSQFDIEFSKIAYYQQYIIINLLIIILGYLGFKYIFKDVQKWEHILKKLASNDVKEIKKIRQKCFTMPHIVYILQILIPLVLVGLLFIILGFNNSADIKFFMVLATFLSLVAVVSYLFSKKYFRKVLKYTYIDDLKKETFQIGLPIKIVLQILPLFLLSTLFIALVGQAGLVKEKGIAMYKSYHRQLMDLTKNGLYIENESQIKRLMNLLETDNTNDTIFYIDPYGKYQTIDQSELSDFFLKYTKELAFNYEGHTYDYYGSDVQGTVIKLPGVGGDWILGVKYQVASSETIVLIIISTIVLLIFAIWILLYFGKTMADDIAIIATGLTEIAEGEEANLNKKIAVISNDEIGDLAVAFNKVQEREKKYIEDMKSQQKVIVEQERLASLGEMISGITHNLKTPIMSLSLAIDSLKDLVREYQASIADQRVTGEDHREIAGEMESWLSEMGPYCQYMEDVLTTVKGQIIPERTALTSVFSLEELLKRVEVLMHYALTTSGCSLRYHIQADPHLALPGEISNLVQVLENLISNGIQAYQGQGGIIELTVSSRGDILEFCVRDAGHGIPAELQSRLFKEMITTKGVSGTGLGLYISHAIVKGKFGGDLWFESVVGQGTSFYMTIPMSQDSSGSWPENLPAN